VIPSYTSTGPESNENSLLPLSIRRKKEQMRIPVLEKYEKQLYERIYCDEFFDPVGEKSANDLSYALSSPAVRHFNFKVL